MYDSRRSLGHKQVNTLVIVDMQEHFLQPTDTYRDVLSQVVKEVRLAKRRGDHILIVEYESALRNQNIIHGERGSEVVPTSAAIHQAIGKYTKACYVYKREMSGGEEVYQTLKEKNIPHSHVRICGVYAEWCVQETVLDLRKKIPKSRIHLVRDGIASHFCDNSRKENAIKDMTFYDNITVLT